MTSNPYDRPSDPAKRKSAALTDGPDRAGARSMLKGTGFTDDDLAKPIIGVATTWIETMPCNLNQRDLAVHVKRGIRDAGATPMEFNTIAVSDGVSMGTSGMRASLVSREVIADSIELVARGHLFDGLVCLVACDKTTPAAIMALGRLDIPAVVFYTGSIAPGLYRGREVSIGDVYEAIGAYAAGKMSAEELHELESVACPAAGACGGQFTANTMSTMVDFLGLTPVGANGIPAVNGAKAEAAYEIGTLAVDVVRRDLRPSQVVTKRGGRERCCRDRRHRRLHERRPPPRRDRPRVRHRLHDRRLRPHLGRDADRRGHEALGSLPRHGRLPRRRRRPGRAGVAQALARPRGRRVRRRTHARRRRRERRGDVGPGRRRPDRDPAQVAWRRRDPARQPRAGGMRREARRPRPHGAPWTGARLRLGGGVLRGGEGAARSSPATWS